jgi:hypothetical protein
VNREPLVTVASITAVVSAVLALVVAFGLDLTADQQAAILGAVAAVAPIAVALIVRPRVTPVPRTSQETP